MDHAIQLEISAKRLKLSLIDQQGVSSTIDSFKPKISAGEDEVAKLKHC